MCLFTWSHAGAYDSTNLCININHKGSSTASNICFQIQLFAIIERGEGWLWTWRSQSQIDSWFLCHDISHDNLRLDTRLLADNDHIQFERNSTLTIRISKTVRNTIKSSIFYIKLIVSLKIRNLSGYNRKNKNMHLHFCYSSEQFIFNNR